MSELENIYQQTLSPVLEKASALGNTELVIGIPFLSINKDTQTVLSVLEAGLDTFYPELKVLIVCAVSPSVYNADAFKNCKFVQEDRILIKQMHKNLSGRGWAIRTLMEIAHGLTADLLILDPNLLTAKSKDSPEGLTPDWIKLMHKPVRNEHAEFVLPRFKSSHLANTICDHLIFPLVATLYNLELRGFPHAGMTISRSLLTSLISDAPDWPPEIYGYGFDYWLLMLVLEQKAEIAEVFLGRKPETSLPVSISIFFRQAVSTVFRAISKGQETWKKNPQGIGSPLIIGPRDDFSLQELTPDSRSHLDSFKRGYARYYETVWSRIFSEELSTQLNEAAKVSDDNFSFPATLWAQLVFESLIAYHFIPELEKEDLISSLIPLFEGRLVGFFSETSEHALPHLSDDSSLRTSTCPFSARNKLNEQIDAFVIRRPSFVEKWLHHKEALQPFLPEISYWEHIPGVPIILPHTVRSASGKTARVSEIYEQLLKEYKEGFEGFARRQLDLSPQDGFEKLGQAIKELMEEVEKGLDTILLPGDLHTSSGIQQVAERIFNLYPTPISFSLKEEVAERLLRKQPPRNLITLWGYRNTDELLANHNPLDVLALSTWSEPARYSAWNNEWLRENLRPEHFELSPIRPLFVSYLDFPALAGMRESSSLNHLTSRVVISYLRKESGGSFPKARFLTIILKNIIDAQQFGVIWESFKNNSGKDFGQKVVNSIEGHSGYHMFSAHSIFENLQQQTLRDKLLEITNQDWGSADPDTVRFRKRLALMASVYHLGITLPDGHFVTCSLWSWASYSFKGGKGIPSPLSLMVERRWFSAELFYRCYEQVGGKRENIFPKIAELMGQGKENEDLAVMLLGAHSDRAAVIVEQNMDKELPPAGKLVRSDFNPILTPIADSNWESKYVLNCGAIRVNGDVHIFYRAVGEDGISRIGLALSKNGLRVDERLPEPVFAPAHESEKMGCEDPRLIAIEGRIYMLYTAYDGVTPQIALASIAEDDLIHQRWQHWHRHGLVFPGFSNKDAVLFPERFNGKLAMYHRIAPSIWVTYSPTFDTPWPREGHKIIMGSRSGMMWDAIKIGAGAQPLKTRFGWLHIYHGVDYGLRYRLGVFLTSLDDPTKLIYRSPNPILEPDTSYEIGVSGESWVPNVVFTCGAVPVLDKNVLDEDDEILVYYGGADTVIGVATASVSTLIPSRYRGK